MQENTQSTPLINVCQTTMQTAFKCEMVTSIKLM